MTAAQHHAYHNLYLIRHGETVDNIAGVYAGITDSALTNHGVQQGIRLGQWFAKHDVVFTHFFSSDLSRAHKTAENVRKSQLTGEDAPEIVLSSDLREQDFGFYERKPFYARSPDSKKTGKDTHRAQHKDDKGFQDIESKESMAKRADNYLDEHLLPLLKQAPHDHGYSIAIVSHGMLLSSLWKAILRRQRPNSVILDPTAAIAGAPVTLEHLGGWSNTGYLHLELQKNVPTEPGAKAIGGSVPTDAQVEGNKALAAEAISAIDQVDDNEINITQRPSPPAGTRVPPTTEGTAAENVLAPTSQSGITPSTEERPPSGSFKIRIKTINGKEHLTGLKRTGGGVGSSKHDEAQKSIETFFKRRKTES